MKRGIKVEQLLLTIYAHTHLITHRVTWTWYLTKDDPSRRIVARYGHKSHSYPEVMREVMLALGVGPIPNVEGKFTIGDKPQNSTRPGVKICLEIR
ncbi:MAG TPA: hypothetical protein VJQ25_06510 [Nitrospira sp.]|nr:hypothetical protein [Nitrospira sp.]